MTLLRFSSLRSLAPLTVAALGALAALAACSSEDAGCTKDTDCATGRVCGTDGRCVDQSTTSTSGGATATTSGGATATTSGGGDATSTTASGTGGASASSNAASSNAASSSAASSSAASTTASTGTGGGDPPAASCKALLTAKPGTPDGVYSIDPDGMGPQPVTDLFCDMTNGGLTLVFNMFNSAGDDAPNTTDYVVSGWQQKGSGQWDAKATKVARDATGNGSAAVSLAFVAALKASAGQMHLRMCFVDGAGTEATCRGSVDASLTLVSLDTTNSKLALWKSDSLTFTFARLAGLAGTADGYSSWTHHGYCVPVVPSPSPMGVYVSNHEFGNGHGGGNLCEVQGGVWAGFEGGNTYSPQGTMEELVPISARPSRPGFRLYVGP